MKTIIKFLAAVTSGLAAFWLTRFGAWVGSLTTVRTELYFTLNGILAWAVAVLAFLCVLTSKWEGE